MTFSVLTIAAIVQMAPSTARNGRAAVALAACSALLITVTAPLPDPTIEIAPAVHMPTVTLGTARG